MSTTLEIKSLQSVDISDRNFKNDQSTASDKKLLQMMKSASIHSELYCTVDLTVLKLNSDDAMGAQ